MEASQVDPKRTLTSLTEGQIIPFGGTDCTLVTAELAQKFKAGDCLIVVQDSGALLHVPRAISILVDNDVADARSALAPMEAVPTEDVSSFYADFAANLSDDSLFESIKTANAADVADARSRGRSTTRLQLDEKMRREMTSALHMWRDMPDPRNSIIETVIHDGWSVDERRAPLGVVGFIFEGRPNVFADATGVLRSGNTVVFRIGSDALNTARAIMTHALIPALIANGLPISAVKLIDSAERSAGHALFSNRDLSLAVARGSGEAVAQLGAVARQSGTPVSLHGTGGAWLIVATSAEPNRLVDVVKNSLDRKVCNTLNVCCLPQSRPDLLAKVLEGASIAATNRRSPLVIHAVGFEVGKALDDLAIDPNMVQVIRHETDDILATEWEWEDRPELSLRMTADSFEAVRLFNQYSPHFVLGLSSEDYEEIQAVYQASDAPFFGNGFTRWVDGQYALKRPELGLSNWQSGRLFARSGILSGDGVFSVRYTMNQTDSNQHR